MKLEEITALIEKRQYDDAISECSMLLTNMPEKKIEILRTRAYAFAKSGDFERSLDDHERIFEKEEVEIKDFYLAGFRALFAARFEKARDWFIEVLRLGKEQNETYFLSATLFYLSYVHLQLLEYGKAIEYLNEAVLIEADIGLPLPEEGVWTGDELRKEIERRALK